MDKLRRLALLNSDSDAGIAALARASVADIEVSRRFSTGKLPQYDPD